MRVRIKNILSVALMIIICFTVQNTYALSEEYKKTYIKSIENIEINISQSKPYSLPMYVKVIMSDRTIKYQPIKWENKRMDISSLGTYEFEGSVKGYNKKVKLTLYVEKMKVDNNVFSLEGLQRLVEDTPVSKEIIEFRQKDNPRRNGHFKMETKYFDVYYPKNDKLAQEYADEIKKYADTSYIFLVKMFGGKQVPAEIYLIYEEEAEKIDSSGKRVLSEGDIRHNELATYVYINKEHTKYKGNIIKELIHEMYHNFYSVINSAWSSRDDYFKLFVDEGIARNIPEIYSEVAFKDMSNGYIEYPIWNEFDSYTRNLKKRMDREDYYPSIKEIAADIGNWGFRNEKEIIRIDSVIFMWYYIYKNYGVEVYQSIITSIGNNNYEKKLEKILGKSLNEIEKEWYVYLKSL